MVVVEILHHSFEILFDIHSPKCVVDSKTEIIPIRLALISRKVFLYK